MTFIQPSSKRLSVELRCSAVNIVTPNSIGSDHWCTREEFHLSSSNALNNVSSLSPVLLLPYHVQHNLELSPACSEGELIYSHYLLAVDKSAWKYAQRQIPLNQRSTDWFEEEYLSNACEEHRSKFSVIIDQESLNYGYYLSHITIQNSNSNHFRHYIQPIEIIHADLTTRFNSQQTVMNDDGLVKLDFLLTVGTKDQSRLNFTLLCYPASSEKRLFTPNGMRLGSSQARENSAFSKLIPWANFTLITRRPELSFYFYEHQCLSASDQSRSFTFDPVTREMNIPEEAFISSNRTLHFDLIMRHLHDGRILTTRRTFNKRTQINFNTTDLITIEHAMSNQNTLTEKDPKQAIDLVGDLAEKLNEISRNWVK